MKSNHVQILFKPSILCHLPLPFAPFPPSRLSPPSPPSSPLLHLIIHVFKSLSVSLHVSLNVSLDWDATCHNQKVKHKLAQILFPLYTMHPRPSSLLPLSSHSLQRSLTLSSIAPLPSSTSSLRFRRRLRCIVSRV